MARKQRTDYPGAWHYVLVRSARHEQVFQNEQHRALLIATLNEASKRRRIEVHASAVLPDRYHLLLCSVNGNLSDFMRDVNGLFTQRLNRLFGWDGPVFRGRYASQLLEGQRQINEVSALLLQGDGPKISNLQGAPAVSTRPAPAGGFKSPDEVLRIVTRISGSSLRDLRQPERGPRANPGRRFAVLALSAWTSLKQREIGQRLNMSAAMVAKTLGRQRDAESLKPWMDKLEEFMSYG